MQLNYKSSFPLDLNESTPIVFLLHGYGSNEEDLFSFQPNLPQNWLVHSFRAPHTIAPQSYYWYDINFDDPENWIHLSQALECIKDIVRDIEELKEKQNLQNSPVHLAGFSQGGILSYALALQFPHLFQKVAILSSYPEMKILRNLQKDNKLYQHLDFFISHGVDDAVIPLDWARKAPEFLENFNINFSFREYNAGHGINPKNYMDLMDFFAK